MVGQVRTTDGAAAELVFNSELTGEPDGSDGGGVVVEGLLQAEAALHVEDVDQPISAARGQELHPWRSQRDHPQQDQLQRDRLECPQDQLQRDRLEQMWLQKNTEGTPSSVEAEHPPVEGGEKARHSTSES